MPALLAALDHGPASLRVEAVWALAHIRDHRAVARLVALLDEPEDSQRGTTDALGLIQEARPVLPLLAALGAEDAALRAEAVDTLRDLPATELVPALISLLGSSIDWIGDGAAQALGVIGPSAVAPLGAVLGTDGDSARRSRAAAALGAIGAPAVPLLLEALRVGAPPDRAMAAQALEEIRDGRSLAPLVGALHDENALVRLYAAKALAHHPDPRAVSALIAALGDTWVRVRDLAVQILGSIGEPAVLPLVRSLGNGSPAARGNAHKALAAIGARAVGRLAEMLPTAGAEDRTRVAEAFGAVSDTTAVPALLALLIDENAQVRATAAWGLGQVRDPRVVPPLLEALVDEASTVRLEAAAALGKQHDARAVEPLIRACREEPAWHVAVDALCAIGAPAREPLIRALEDARRGSGPKRRSGWAGSTTGAPSSP